MRVYVYMGQYLHNGIHRTRFLTETAVNALGHINVIARGLAGAVGTRLGLDGDGLRRADGFAQLARDAPLLTGGVSAKKVLSSETCA